MNKKGFTATAIVISIVMLVSMVILFMLSTNEHNAALTKSISLDTKMFLSEADAPNCSWGVSPHIILNNGNETSVIALNCSHIEGIETNVSDYLNPLSNAEYISHFISVFSDVKNKVLNVTVENIITTKKGYKMLFRLEPIDTGKYYLELKENTICTTKRCNKALKSDIITIIK